MRRTITVGLHPERLLPCEYRTSSDYAAVTDGPFGALLRQEIRRIESKARMSERQAAVFDCVVCGGLTQEQTAAALNIKRSSVRIHLRLALDKAMRVPYVGLFTILVEEFGWAGIRALLRDL